MARVAITLAAYDLRRSVAKHTTFFGPDISLTVMAMCQIILRGVFTMKLNESQRVGISNVLSNIAVGQTFCLMLAVFFETQITWLKAALMCSISAILVVISIYIRSPSKKEK